MAEEDSRQVYYFGNWAWVKTVSVFVPGDGWEEALHSAAQADDFHWAERRERRAGS